MKHLLPADPIPFLTKVIQQLMVILGSEITIMKARQITGLTLSDDGRVIQVNISPEKLLQQLEIQFSELSPFAFQKVVDQIVHEDAQTASVPESLGEVAAVTGSAMQQQALTPPSNAASGETLPPAPIEPVSPATTTT